MPMTRTRRGRTIVSLMAILVVSRLGLNFWRKTDRLSIPLFIQVQHYSKSAEEQPISKPSSFKVIAAGICKKKDGSRAKYGKCGEDSYLISVNDPFVSGKKSLLAVADGVGGWGDHGGDSSQVSNAFMAAMKKFHEASDKWYGLPSLIKASFEYLITLRSSSKGTTTICSAAFDHENSELEISNIGDSQLVVVRNGKVALEVEAGVWGFNSPNQIGFGIYGEPQGDVDELNIEKRFKLAKGDVVILGTDGLFDNVFVEKIAEMTSNQVPRTKDGVETLARNLLKEAYKNGLDDNFLSPFAREAIDAGKAPSYYRGGKPDDISIIVACVE